MGNVMNSIDHEKSLAVLEAAIVHFLVIGQFGIVAELCELLLECDDKIIKTNETPSVSGSTSTKECKFNPELKN